MKNTLLSRSQQKSYVVILANGSFPRSEKALSYFSDARRLVCCDGATNKAVANGLTPDFIVGDIDSLDPALKTRFGDRIVHSADQECNDLTKAFRFCISREWRDIVILGASGEREDHLIGNVSLLAEFVREADSIEMVTDFGRFCPVLQPGVFQTRQGQQISIFSFDRLQEITSKGLKYPLKKMTLPLWYMATLNEALGGEFSLDFTSGSPLILYFVD